MEHGGRTPPFSGNGPNGQAPPHCGTCSSLRGVFDVLPVAELLVVDARTTAACPKQLSTESTSHEENDSSFFLHEIFHAGAFAPPGASGECRCGRCVVTLAPSLPCASPRTRASSGAKCSKFSEPAVPATGRRPSFARRVEFEWPLFLRAFEQVYRESARRRSRLVLRATRR